MVPFVTPVCTLFLRQLPGTGSKGHLIFRGLAHILQLGVLNLPVLLFVGLGSYFRGITSPPEGRLAVDGPN